MGEEDRGSGAAREREREKKKKKRERRAVERRMRTLRCLRGGVRRVLLHSPPCKTSASNQTSCTSSSSLRAAASFAASNYSHSSAHAAVKGTFRETFSLREMTQSLKEVVQQKQQNVFGGLRRAFSSSTAEKSSSAASSNSKREAALASLQKKEQEALSTFFHEPKGPVTAAEGGTYSLVIGAGLLVAAACGYAVFKELFVETLEYQVYGKALEEIQQDPRVMVRLGSPIKGYGSDSRNRRARQKITHRRFRQEDGTEHCQVQFQASGPNGRATVHADMFEKDKNGLQYAYLIVDVTHPPGARARINILNANK